VRYRASLVADIANEALKAVRPSLLLACREEGIPVIALPHGISTKMEAAYNPKIATMLQREGGKLPQEDRNSFAVWVHNTERERDVNIAVGGMRPEIAEVWRSVRFSPEWMCVMRTACPPSSVAAKPAGRQRVVFFLP